MSQPVSDEVLAFDEIDRVCDDIEGLLAASRAQLSQELAPPARLELTTALGELCLSVTMAAQQLSPESFSPELAPSPYRSAESLREGDLEQKLLPIPDRLMCTEETMPGVCVDVIGDKTIRLISDASEKEVNLSAKEIFVFNVLIGELFAAESYASYDDLRRLGFLWDKDPNDHYKYISGVVIRLRKKLWLEDGTTDQAVIEQHRVSMGSGGTMSQFRLNPELRFMRTSASSVAAGDAADRDHDELYNEVDGYLFAETDSVPLIRTMQDVESARSFRDELIDIDSEGIQPNRMARFDQALEGAVVLAGLGNAISEMRQIMPSLQTDRTQLSQSIRETIPAYAQRLLEAQYMLSVIVGAKGAIRIDAGPETLHGAELAQALLPADQYLTVEHHEQCDPSDKRASVKILRDNMLEFERDGRLVRVELSDKEIFVLNVLLTTPSEPVEEGMLSPLQDPALFIFKETLAQRGYNWEREPGSMPSPATFTNIMNKLRARLALSHVSDAKIVVKGKFHIDGIRGVRVMYAVNPQVEWIDCRTESQNDTAALRRGGDAAEYARGMTGHLTADEAAKLLFDTLLNDEGSDGNKAEVVRYRSGDGHVQAEKETLDPVGPLEFLLARTQIRRTD